MKDDDKIDYQAYYVRINPLRQFLSEFGANIFEIAWGDDAEQEDLQGFRRGHLAGELLCDIVRAFQVTDATDAVPAVGDWFTYSGAARYKTVAGVQHATIKLRGNVTLVAVVRPECRLSGSAAVNMQGRDDVSTIVGRRISDDKFDLVAAGYRDPMVHWRSSGRTVELGTSSRDHALDRPWRTEYMRGVLPHVNLRQDDNATLSFLARDTAERFAQAVENEGAWRSLYSETGTPVHEARHQILYQVFSRLLFSALGVQVDPHADHGAGATDLTLSLNGIRHIIEFKKDSSRSAIAHGYEVQLPLYMKSAGASSGTFVILCHSGTKEDALQSIRSQNRAIGVVAVDCRRRSSASRA